MISGARSRYAYSILHFNGQVSSEYETPFEKRNGWEDIRQKKRRFGRGAKRGSDRFSLLMQLEAKCSRGPKGL